MNSHRCRSIVVVVCVHAACVAEGERPSALVSTITALSPVVADGQQASRISIAMRDASGNPIEGKTPTIVVTGSGNNTPVCTESNHQGVATCSVSSTRAETKGVAVTSPPALTSLTATIVFVAAPVAAATSSMHASSGAVADGLAGSTVTLFLLDAFLNPIAGLSPTLAVSGEGAVVGACSGSSVMGVSTCFVTSTKAEVKTLTVTAPSELAELTTDVAFVAGTPSATKSTVTTDGPTLADGEAACTLSVTFLDADDNPVSGLVPTYTVSGSNNVAAACGASDSTGVATCQITSTSAETKTITLTAPVAVLSKTTTAVFVAGPATAASTLVASDAVADGETPSIITITLLDANDNPIVGMIPTYDVNGSGNDEAACLSSDDAGVSTCSLTSTVAETKTVTLLTPTELAGLADEILVMPGPAALDASSIAATSPKTADGNATSLLTVTLIDANGNAHVGVVPTYTVDGTGHNLGSCAAADATGVSTCALASTLAGTHAVTLVTPAELAGLATDVVFVAGALEASQCTLAATSPAVADGSSQSIVTVTFRDAYGNPISGLTPTYSVTPSAGTSASACTESNASGASSCALTASTSGTRTIALLTPTALSAMSVQVSFNASDASPAQSVLTATTPKLANGSDASTITLTMRDTLDNPVIGVTPTYSVSGTGNSASACSVSDANGTSTCSFTSTTPGSKTVSVTSPASLTSLSANVFMKTPFTASWDFSASSDYTFDAGLVSISGGVARLLPVSDQTDDANDSQGFAAGSHYGTRWNQTSSMVDINASGTIAAMPLPDYGISTWFDMEENVMLAHFDEAASATTFANNYDPGNGFSCTSCPTSGAAGKFGNALDFNGSQWVQTLGNSFLSTYRTGAIAFWFKTDSNASQTIFDYFASNYAGLEYDGGLFTVYINTSGKLVVLWYIGTAANETHSRSISGGTNVADGQWHHAVIASNGASTNQLYVDGAAESVTLSTSHPSAGSYTDWFSNTYSVTKYAHQVTIGRTLGAFAGGFFKGSIDEVAVWKRPLSANEVKLLYTQRVGYYDSRIFDAGSSAPWDSLTWTTARPTQKALPDNKATESAYAEGNVSMASNMLLLHLDGALGTITSGTKFTDHSDSNVSTAVTGAPSYVNAKIDQGISFSGGGQYLTFPDLPGFPAANFGTGDFSFSAWMKTAYQGFHTLIAKRTACDGFQAGFGVFQLGTGNVQFLLGASPMVLQNLTVTSAKAINDGEWHLVTVTRSGTTAKVYIDGVADGSATSNSTLNITNSTNLSVAYSPCSGTGKANFTGTLDEVALWTRALAANEVLDIYRRGTQRLSFQVRSCDDAACSGEAFVGPDGSIYSFFSDPSDLGLPLVDVASVAMDNRYFQYRTLLSSGSTTYVPGLRSVTITPTRYSANDPTVVNKTSVIYSTVTNFEEALGSSNAGSVRYQLSPDGAGWYYHNGASWVVASGYAQSNSVAEVDASISQFGAGNFYFKAFLHSDGSSICELDEVSVDGSQ